jgi:hypothetical protein
VYSTPKLADCQAWVMFDRSKDVGSANGCAMMSDDCLKILEVSQHRKDGRQCDPTTKGTRQSER